MVQCKVLGQGSRILEAMHHRKEKQKVMVVAIVGLPPGLSVPDDMKQLKALIERPNDDKSPTVSYWEKRWARINILLARNGAESSHTVRSVSDRQDAG